MRVKVAVELPAPPETVWADVADVASHVEWMADAESIDVVSEQRAGVGTEIDVATRVGPFRTRDRMHFTEWEAPHRMGVDHRGLVTGSGAFTLEPTAAGTRFVWEETIRFPWYLGGPIGALVARPVLAWIWRRNLRRLRARF